MQTSISIASDYRFTTVLKWLMLICGVMFLGGLIFFLPAAVRRDLSTEWPTTAGQVTSTGLKLYLHKPHMEPSFTPVIYYSYLVGDIPRVGTRIDFSDSLRTFHKDAALNWLKSNYPVGKAVKVYYDPSKPEASALIPGARDLVLICYWWLATMAICAVVSFALYRAHKLEDFMMIANHGPWLERNELHLKTSFNQPHRTEQEDDD